MRFILFSLLSIFLICFTVVLTVNSITGQVPITPNCGGERTYAFYRTLEEKADVEAMWRQAGFIPTTYEEAPDSFQSSGYTGFMCMRRMTRQELQQDHMRQRDRVITQGSSI
jgi:hypothetical protein